MRITEFTKIKDDFFSTINDGDFYDGSRVTYKLRKNKEDSCARNRHINSKIRSLEVFDLL